MSDEYGHLLPLTQGGKSIRPAQIKADTGDSGQYEAIVSVFGNIDYVGDVVEVGAYTDDIASWKSSGDPLPVIWSHQWSDPDYHIGVVTDAKELEPGHADLPEELKPYGGLWTAAQLDMDAPKAAQVFRLLKGRRVKQFSFHYDVLEATYGKQDGEYVRFLKRLHLNETGPTLLGANARTDLLDAKAAASALTAEEVTALRAILAAKHLTSESTAPEPDVKSHAGGPRLGVEETLLAIALRAAGIAT